MSERAANDPIGRRLPEWAAAYWERDLVKILGTLGVVYALYLLAGVILGYDLSGQLNSLRRITFLIVVYGIAALVVNLHWGYSGLFNIGVVGFMAIGVYTATILSSPVAGQNPIGSLPGFGVPLPIAAVVGILVAAAAGYVAALPSLRLRDDYFAIVTLAFAEIVRITFKSSVLQEVTVFGWTFGTGGGRGIRTFSNPVRNFFNTTGQPIVAAVESLGIDGQLVSGWAFVFALLLILIGTYWLISRLSASPFGRVLKGIRDDEEATQSLAKETSSFKIRAFVIGCGILGLLGIIWQGASSGYITPGRFVPELTFFIWIAVIVGGAGSNTGTIIGTILFVGIIYEGPGYVRQVVEQLVDITDSVPTFPDAVAAIGGGDITPMLAYIFDQTSTLRVVLTGLVLIWLLKRRPEGLFGHRREVAASIDLEERVRSRRQDSQTEQAERGDAD